MKRKDSTKNERFKDDPAKNESLVLVDLFDLNIGHETKETIHVKGLLHRAFSIVVYRETDGEVEILLSQRSDAKYHSGGLWANACCSHPRNGEEIIDAARRRIMEELCISPISMEEIGDFVYRAVLDNGLIEYECDHVLLAKYDGIIKPNKAEVKDYQWISINSLNSELVSKPDVFASWVFMVFSLAIREIQAKKETYV